MITMIRLSKTWFLGLTLLVASATAALQSPATTGDSRTARILYLNNRGVALLDQYKFKEAVAEFQQILRLAPDLVAAHVNLGIAYFYDQKYPEAVASLNRALELRPNQVHAHYLLGLIHRNQDEPEKAIAAFEAVNRQDPQDTSTNYYLGTLWMRQRDYQKAARYFQDVIEQEPYNASAFYNLAMAYNRNGQREEGQQSMQQFQRLQELFGSTTVGLQYLEQGRYAMAIDTLPVSDLPGASEPPSPVAVTFAEVGEAGGLRFQHAGPGQAPMKVTSAREARESLVPYLGSGLAFQDFDRDGWVDLYLSNAGKSGVRGALYRNRGDGTFADVTEAAGLTHLGQTMHAVWGDYDSDGYPDLYLINYGPNVLYRNLGNGRFEDVTAATGTGHPAWGLGGGFVDYDHDGDLDLYVVNFSGAIADFQGEKVFPRDFAGAPNVLYRNNGNGTFTDVSAESGLAGRAQRSLAVLTSDLDDSRDVDFLVINHGSPHQLLNNVRDGSFRPADLGRIAAGAANSVSAADFDRDGLIDLSIPATGELWHRNLGHSRFEPGSRPSVRLTGPILSTQFFDFDNDGDMDLLVLSAPYLDPAPELSRGRNLHLFENRNGQLIDVSEAVGLHRYSGLAVRGVAIADWDNDGDLDFAVTVNGGRPLLFRNDGGNRNNWLAVVPIGTNSNRSGLGVKAEIRAGALWLKQESYGAQGFLSQNSPVLHFGLGQHSQADIIRLLWPNGVLQSEIDRPANQRVSIEELDRKGTSCPILYVWDGTTYRFQTDFLGGSAYGSLLAPGAFNDPDTDEYVKLNRDDVALKDGRVEITMNNQLEEVILFDQLELVVVDHPADYEVYPDEKLLPGPPYQPFRLFSAAGARPPKSAVDWAGRDILPRISAIDRVYMELPNLLPFKGYAEEHSLTLDLGDTTGDEPVLLLHAWIDYADSTSNLAAAQAGVRLVPPYLQVLDGAGQWVTVIERMGFPAGLPKTMTVDLSGKFLSSARKVRIVTSMRIYWDQILVADGVSGDDLRIHRIAAAAADLEYRGYPLFYSPDGRQPKIYDYDRDMSAEWKVHVGAYTRFGDVRPLLAERDDMYVVTRSGDQIRAAFDVSGLPELPEGWTRDYLVYVDGFGKDMDPNSASPNFLGPLPFHGMTAYPYPEEESYPRSPEHRRYLEDWNTRIYHRAVPDLPRRRAD